MATLAGVNGGSLVPDVSGGLNMLLQTFGTKQSREEDAVVKAKQQQVSGLANTVANGTNAEQEKALVQLSALDPKIAESMRGALERGDKNEQAQITAATEKGMRTAAYISKQPTYAGKINALTEMAQEAHAQGESVDKFVELSNLSEGQLDNRLMKMQVFGTSVDNLFKPATREELKSGDQIITQSIDPVTGQATDIATADRFQSKLLTPEELAQKKDIASSGRSTTEVNVGNGQGDPNIVTPPALLDGLPEGTARKVDAVFRAAGGGKDGIDSINKVMEDFDEQERRQLAPNILTNSFPNASEAERSQLDAAMSAAKNTETGLAEAQKIRTEQRRLKKAKSFQERAVSLLDRIIKDPQLSDVTGSIQGAYDSRPFSDAESSLIADIAEAQNILTADNLDLMTGVLSETDMGVIRSLAGGALNRRRGTDKFLSDVSSLRGSLSSKTVQTVDDLAGKTVGRFNVKVKETN